jgi:hypothetical protein
MGSPSVANGARTLTTMPQPPTESSELREFMIVVRQALMLIVSWIERRYGLTRRV